MLILVSKNSKHVALSSDKISFGVKDTSFPNVLRIMAEKKCLSSTRAFNVEDSLER